jgi:hypothetical protein
MVMIAVKLQFLDRALRPTISQKLKSFKSELAGFKSQIVEPHFISSANTSYAQEETT